MPLLAGSQNRRSTGQSVRTTDLCLGEPAPVLVGLRQDRRHTEALGGRVHVGDRTAPRGTVPDVTTPSGSEPDRERPTTFVSRTYGRGAKDPMPTRELPVMPEPQAPIDREQPAKAASENLETTSERTDAGRERGRNGADAIGIDPWRRNPVTGRTKYTRLVMLAVAGLVAAMALAACGDDEGDDGGGESEGGSGTIGFLLPESQTARYESQDKPLFEAKVEELCPDCEIFYQNADQDPAKQQQQVEAAVTEGVDVLVLDPVDSTAAAAMVTRANDADIPVISYDRLILDADLAAYAEFNSPEVGTQQGEALAEKLAEDGNPEGPIVKINGDPKDNNAKLFDEGSDAALSDAGVEVAEESDTPDWLPENAQQQMEQAITALGKDGFAGVYAANDGTAGGAIAALKSAGLDPSKVPVTGQDAELAAIQRIIAGEQYVTVYKPIKPLADNAATLAVAVINGEDPAESDVINGSEDNGLEDVPAAITDTVPVFADNVNDTILADDYWSVDEICTGQYAQACKEAGIQ